MLVAGCSSDSSNVAVNATSAGTAETSGTPIGSQVSPLTGASASSTRATTTAGDPAVAFNEIGKFAAPVDLVFRPSGSMYVVEQGGKVAIMSNGTTKGCGAETFKTLKTAPSIQAIYQTHRNLRVPLFTP